jgi:hypothetical protein
MPTLSRYFVRSALIYLGIGFTLGAFILSAKAGFVDARLWAWLPMHMVILIDGWLIQLTMGVGYWILPRIQGSDRGRSFWAWASFALFQLGLALTLLTLSTLWFPAIQSLFAPAVILQTVGVVFFAIHAYPRIHPALVRKNVS